jgi:hypothetical protein
MKQYLTVPVPYKHQGKGVTPPAVAGYFSQVLNQYAAQGWRLHSAPEVVVDPAGGVLQMAQAATGQEGGSASMHYMLIFERDV